MHAHVLKTSDYRLSYARVQDKCQIYYCGASRAGKYLLGRQFHKVSVLHSADMVLCFWINIDESFVIKIASVFFFSLFLSLFIVLSERIRLLHTGDHWLWCSDDAAKYFSRWNVRSCLSQPRGSSARQNLQTCNFNISVITSRDILLIKLYCKTNLNDGRSQG